MNLRNTRIGALLSAAQTHVAIFTQAWILVLFISVMLSIGLGPARILRYISGNKLHNGSSKKKLS